MNDRDNLRLIALGRISRCTDCPRYRALVHEYLEYRAGRTSGTALPAVPGYCHFQACAPMAARYGGEPANAA